MTLALLFAERSMTPVAWIFLLGTWGIIVALNLWCVVRILGAKRKG